MAKSSPPKIHHPSKLAKFLSLAMMYPKKAARKIGFVKNLSCFDKIILAPSLKKTFFAKPILVNTAKSLLKNALAGFVFLPLIQPYMDLKNR